MLMYIFRVKLWKYTKWKTKQRWEDDIKNGVGFNLIGSGSKSEWMSNEDFLVDILKWLRRGGGGGEFLHRSYSCSAQLCKNQWCAVLF